MDRSFCRFRVQSAFRMFALLVGILVAWTATTAHAQFAGGSGTEADPYQIATIEHLHALRDVPDAHARQTGPIDAGVAPWLDGEGWLPIAEFRGVYEGGGHPIINLTIDRPSLSGVGLFNTLSGATVRNLRLENVNVRGNQYVGGLAGVVSGDSLVEHVSVSGDVRGTHSTGGAVGSLQGSALHHASFEGRVQGGSSTGGLLGRMEILWSTLYHSSAKGAVQGAGDTGGLLGSQRLGIVADSFSHAQVDGGSSSHVGGLLGYLGGSTSSYAHLYRSYSTGAITATGSFVGGLVGRLGSYASAADNYWDMVASGRDTSGTGEGRSTADMLRQSTYGLFNFSTLWRIQEDLAYPEFQPLSLYEAPQAVALVDLPGNGTAENPYLLATARELLALHLDPTAWYRLSADIDLSASVAWNAGQGWTPVSSFSGGLDGAGHAIRHLASNRSAANGIGLFNTLSGATVHNLRLENVNVRGNQFVGGLAGVVAAGSLVAHVSVSGAVRGTHATGGAVGSLQGGALHDVSFEGRVQGGSSTGGLLGRMEILWSTLYHSSAKGAVQGAGETGGLVGTQTRGIVADCFSHAQVDGGSSSNVGGLLGYIAGSYSSYAFLHRSYSTGAVTTTGSYPGGLVGRLGSYVSAADNYWDRETSGQEASAVGTAQTTVEMLQQATYALFNFTTLWRQEEGVDYPRFRDLSVHVEPPAADLATLAGQGTEADPYQLSTVAELLAMSADPAAWYRLMNDLDLTATVAWNAGQGWTPLSSFSGGFDGGGYSILKLTVNRPTTSQIGLFQTLSGATVRNLRLDSVNIRGNQFVGALAGTVSGASLVEHVRVGGDVRGSYSTGGAVGSLQGSALHHASFAGRVQGGSSTGGLLGRTEITGGGTVNFAFALGAVQGDTDTGGLVGTHMRGSVADSYSRASVDGGSANAGGLLGYIAGSYSSYAFLHRSYSTGAVRGVGTYMGGLVGRQGSYTSVADNYWDWETSGRLTSGTGVAISTEESRQQATFVNWNFDDTWSIEEAVNAPVLQGTLGTVHLSPVNRLHRNDASSAQDIGVMSNVAWITEANADWIVLQGIPSGRNTGVVSYALAANPGAAHREGTITVHDGNGSAAVYTVYQGPELELGPALPIHAAPASSAHRVTVHSTVNWTAATSADWIVLATPAEGQDDGDFVYRVTENTALTPRSGTVLVSGGGLERSLLVEQRGTASQVEPEPLWHPYPQAAATGQNIDVLANDAWTAAVEADWITLTGGESGAGSAQVTLSLDANATPHPRLGLLRVASASQDWLVRITQEPSEQVALALLRAPVEGGAVSGAGLYLQGQHVEALAQPAVHYDFVHWTEDGAMISDAPLYSYTAESHRRLTAEFTLKTYMLVYSAGLGGVVNAGPNDTQQVTHGMDATEVLAEGQNGAHFRRWSDGLTQNPRRDLNVTGPLTLTAEFQSAGGVLIDWYGRYEYAPGVGESWTDLDALQPEGKPTTLLEEYIADTDPREPTSLLRVIHMELGPPFTVRFKPGSVNRTYTLQSTTDPQLSDSWQDVPDVEPKPGDGGETELSNPAPAAGIRFYRVKVRLPE